MLVFQKRKNQTGNKWQVTCDQVTCSNNVVNGNLQTMNATMNATLVQIRPKLSLSWSFACWLIVILLAAVAIKYLDAPVPVAATAPAAEFSAERAMAHVLTIAHLPHPIGSDDNQAVREYLVAQLTSLGLKPQLFSAVGIAQGPRGMAIGNTNDVVGRLPGRDSSPAILLMAHYDSVYRAPGAADDGSGVAAILESVRALRAGPPLAHDVIVLFTDGEEAGLLGADAFTNSHPWMKDVAVVLNLEARGNRGPSLLFETGPNNTRLIKAVGEAAPYPVGSSLFYALYKLLPNDTDFTRFRSKGFPGLNFAFGAGLDAYHSRLDSAENLSAASLQHHGSYVLSLTRYLGQKDLTQYQTKEGDSVFFDWFGRYFISYPEKWVLPGETLATLLLILALLLAIRDGEVRASRVLAGLLPSVALLIAIPLVAAAAGWIVLRLLGRSMVFGDSSSNSWILTGLVFASASAGSLTFAAIRKRFSVLELWISGLIVVCILSWALAMMLPAGSYLLFWPLFWMSAGLLAAVLMKRAGQPNVQFAASLVGVVTTILLFAPLIYLVYVFLTLQLIIVAAMGLLLGLFFLLLSPAMDVALPRPATKLVAAALLAGAVASVGVGAATSGHSAAHPQRDSLFYSLNADDHTAAWISNDAAPDKWNSRFFPSKQAPHPMPNYLAGLQRPVLASAAPPLNLAPPIAEMKADETTGETRNVRINVHSQRKARALVLIWNGKALPVSIRAGGRQIVPRTSSGSFTIYLAGMDGSGIDLELSFKAPFGISFWLYDQSDGLPSSVSPRPSDLMAGEGSDVIMVARKYSF